MIALLTDSRRSAMKKRAKKAETRGRKPLPEGERRERTIPIRLTDEEWELIEEAASAGEPTVKRGQFVRDAAIEKARRVLGLHG